MAALPEAVVTPAGVVPAPRAAAAGDTVIPTDDTYVSVNNASGASINVTIPAKKTCNQGALHDLVVAVAAAQTKIIGPIKATYQDPVTGLASVNYSATASVTVYSIRQ